MIGIVGAGITGVTLANLVKECIVFEGEVIGGKIRTLYYDYGDRRYFIELGPDSIVFDKQKLSLLEKFFPGLFNQKNFVKKNPTYIVLNKYPLLLPTNFKEFLFSPILTLHEKLNFLINFFKNMNKNIDINDSFANYCINRFGLPFSRKILFPLFETVFGISASELVTKFVYPFIKKMEKDLFYKPSLMFNDENGLASVVNTLSKNLQIIHEKVQSIYFDGNQYLINNNYRVNKLVLTGEADKILSILKSIKIQDIEYKSLIEKLVELVGAINYHSSFVHVFILKKKINFDANGIIFKSPEYYFIKSITFFSKKWYDHYDIEIIRIFSVDSDYEQIYQELKKFLKILGYNLEDQVRDYFSVSWRNSLINYDQNYNRVISEINDYLVKLRKYGIFIFGSFIGGSGILDRMIYCINNYHLIS